MGSFARVRTHHSACLAIYRTSGAVCAVPDSKLGDVFRPVYLYQDDALEPESGVLVGEGPDAGFFIRPYAFGVRAIPVHVRPGMLPDTVGLSHVGTRFWLSARLGHAMEHFAAIIGNGENCYPWECFTLEPVADDEVPASLLALAATIPARYTPKGGLIDLYSHFSCDMLAAWADVPPIAKIMSAFESLGDNCEFGSAQRGCHAEPLGLLRFGGGLGIVGVTVGLREQFDRIAQVENMRCILNPANKDEYLVTDQAYGLVYHTWRDDGQAEPDTVIAEEIGKLRYLKGKIIEDLEDAAKVFVFKMNDPVEDQHLVDLLAALRTYGKSTLLSVVLADEDHPAGTVVPITDGLLRGYIERFAPYSSAWDVSVLSWIRICRNAYALSR